MKQAPSFSLRERLAVLKRQFKHALLCVSAMLVVSVAGAAELPLVSIGEAHFGLFDASAPGELTFEPNEIVPRRVGQRYGWVIEVKTTKRRVSVREEYLLPPKAGETAAPDTILMDTRRQVSQRELALIDGKIYGEWSVGPGEPAGRRHLQVFVDNELAGDFRFEVR